MSDDGKPSPPLDAPSDGDVIIEPMGAAFRIWLMIGSRGTLLGYGQSLDRATRLARKRVPAARIFLRETDRQYRIV